MLDTEIKQVRQATHELMQAGDFDNAKPLIETLLEENPNDAAALNFMGYILLENNQFHLAYQFIRRALQEKPGQASLWVNFGLAAHHLDRNDEAMGAYMKAAQLDNSYTKAYSNAAALFVNESQWDEAEKAASLALDIDPSDDIARSNMAHVKLARHEWAEGWKLWELSLGGKYRKEWAYGNEKRWDGSKGQAVVVYGEQGLGDEVAYASCIPDAIADCKKVIIDCDPRLQKLFARSFPKADVHGTRREESPAWLEGARIDARCSIASLPGFYRNSDEAFPGTPYLKADPELRKMWRSLFDSYGKPVYGLCLCSGGKLTDEKSRVIEPEQFSPLFALDANFISLDYKGEMTHPKMQQFQFATRASDYDITAALIAELDAVIGINTTAMHVANGLGVKTHILLPERIQWRYEGSYLWSKTCTLYRKAKGQTWRDLIKGVVL